MRVERLHLVAAGALLATACSFFGTTGPGEGDTDLRGRPACTESTGLPMLDLAATLVFVGVAGFQYYDLETHDHPPDEEPEPHTQPLVIGVTLPAAIVYGIAASVGFRRTSDCRDALREFDEEDDASTAPPAAGEPGAPGMPCRRYPGVDDAWVCGRGTKCNAQHVCEPVE